MKFDSGLLVHYWWVTGWLLILSLPQLLVYLIPNLTPDLRVIQKTGWPKKWMTDDPAWNCIFRGRMTLKMLWAVCHAANDRSNMLGVIQKMLGSRWMTGWLKWMTDDFGWMTDDSRMLGKTWDDRMTLTIIRRERSERGWSVTSPVKRTFLGVS